MCVEPLLESVTWLMSSERLVIPASPMVANTVLTASSSVISADLVVDVPEQAGNDNVNAFA